uniref:Uncharacterized protein n=1 Tax=Arundo donax TaxID=35708 RepID=A0A0A9I6C7_ARUDO
MLLHIILHRQRLDSGYHGRTTLSCIIPQYLTKEPHMVCLAEPKLATDMFLHLGGRLAFTIQTT